MKLATPTCSAWLRLRAGVSLTAALLAMTLGGCGEGDAAGDGKTFKLGVEAPLTGPDAESGTAVLNATKMAFEEVGNRVGGYRIEIVPIDDKADPTAAVSAYTFAITGENVGAIFGNWNTDVTLAVMDVAERRQVPHFFSGALGQAVDDKVKENEDAHRYFLGKQYPPPGEQQVSYVEALETAVEQGLELPAGKTVALFAEDTDFGRSVVEALREKFEARGWQVEGEEFFPLDETNHLAMLNTFKGRGVSVVAGTGTALQGMANLIKQARDINPSWLIIADGLSYTGDWYQATKAASDGVLDLHAEFATEEASKFREQYRTQFRGEPSPFSAGITYDYAKFMIEVMKRAVEEHGELTSETLQRVGEEELKTGKLTYDGMMMKEYRFTPETWPSPVAAPDAYIAPVVQYRSGKPQIVYPPDLARHEIRLERD